MRLHEHGVDEVVVKFRVLLLDGPRRIDEIHAAAHQWYDPADDGCNERDPPRRQPRPTDAARQPPGQQPMLDENAARQPDEPRHAGGEQKRRQGHALVVGTRGSEPLCQIAVRLGVGFAPSVPGAHGQRMPGERFAGAGGGSAFGNCRHHVLRVPGSIADSTEKKDQPQVSRLKYIGDLHPLRHRIDDRRKSLLW